jgi:histidyl-tRNA synthetase
MARKGNPLQRIKGTVDIHTEEVRQWQSVESVARTLLEQANYTEIRPPILEYTELFARGVGETTDIVSKEMFTFELNNRSLTLRPEGTAGVVRAYLENNLSRQPKPVKLFYMGPMFRYERPQEGRQRQFHQLGVELFGLDTPASDAEVILMAMNLFKNLGLTEAIQLEVNNVGTPIEREHFKDALKKILMPSLSNLCESCQTRYYKNPLRMLDCKVPGCQEIYRGPDVQNFLETYQWPETSQKPFEETLQILDHLQIPYQNARQYVLFLKL